MNRWPAVYLTRLVEHVVRTDGRRVLAGLIRLTGGDFDAAEDALQEAYTRALVAWPRDGIPDQPGAWLNTVSRRIALDRIRRNRTTNLPDDFETTVSGGSRGSASASSRRGGRGAE